MILIGLFFLFMLLVNLFMKLTIFTLDILKYKNISKQNKKSKNNEKKRIN